MKSTSGSPSVVPDAVLDSPVEGRNLEPGTFGDQLGERTLLVFLRHLG